MSLARHGKRQLSRGSHLTTENHVWISDRLLDDAWDRFSRSHSRPNTNFTNCHSKAESTRKEYATKRERNGRKGGTQIRSGSSVPGPLEARRRATKKRITGLAYVGPSAPPTDEVTASFGLRSWLPPTWGSPAGKMHWEPPDSRIWSTHASEARRIDMSAHTREASIPVHDTKIPVQWPPKAPATPQSKPFVTQDALEGRPETQQREIDGIETELRFGGSAFGGKSCPQSIAEALRKQLSMTQDCSAVVEFLNRTAKDTPLALVSCAPVVVDHLFNHVSVQDEYHRATPLLYWLRSWLSTVEPISGTFDLSLLKMITGRAPGRQIVPNTQAVDTPFTHLIYSKLCLWVLDVVLKHEQWTLELISDKALLSDTIYALAKSDFPDMSCHLVSELCQRVARTPDFERIAQIFLEEFCFLNSRHGPFQQGLSVHRVLPLAGFLKAVSTTASTRRIIQSVTLERLGKSKVQANEEEPDQIDFWFKAISASNTKLDKFALDIVVRTLGLMDQPQLMADFLTPFSPAERCRILLGAWVPKDTITREAASILKQRSRAYEVSREQATNEEWYWVNRTPMLSLFASIRSISPLLAQEQLPRILHVCICLGDYTSIVQISNYLRWKKLLVPYNMLRKVMEPLFLRSPEIVRHLVEHDPRPLPIQHPEYIEKMIRFGIKPRKIQYLIQRAVGIATVVSGPPPPAAVRIDASHLALICRAVEAWVLLPSPRAEDAVVPAVHLSGHMKFNAIVRIIALFVDQPAALDPRLLSALYEVIVDLSIRERRPISRWRLHLANRVAKALDHYDLSKQYTLKAHVHNFWLDVGPEAIPSDPEAQDDEWQSGDQDRAEQRYLARLLDVDDPESRRIAQLVS